ncbi:hypothetical protein PENTCL1PPCAC_19136, partial [Pristionchus entomophagus]
NTQTDEISLDAMYIKIEEMLNENMEHPMHRENEDERADYPNPVTNSLDAMSTTPNFTKSFP